MSSEKQEWLSQAADNHALTAEQLSELLQQPDLQDTVQRYQLAGAVLRNEPESVLPLDFADQLSNMLEQEPTYQLQNSNSLLHKLKSGLLQAANAEWFKPAAHGAIAASVALVAVFGVQQYQQPLEQQLSAPTALLQTRPIAGFATPVSLSQTSVENRFEAQEQQAIQEQQQRLQALLQAHRQQIRVSETQANKTTTQEKREQ